MFEGLLNTTRRGKLELEVWKPAKSLGKHLSHKFSEIARGGTSLHDERV